MESLTAWFAGRLPDGWFTTTPEVTVDREEILVVGTVPEPDYPADADAAGRRAAQQARIIRIAEDAERRTGRKVAWGARCGDERQVFTSLSVPVMTRLRMPERQVLDTLVSAGVARSRSDALGWCVRLVRDHQGEWIQQLQDALVAVREARAAGPAPSAD